MGTTLNGIYIPDDGENSWGTQVSNNLRRQSEHHINVKAYGAVGNGSTDDTAAIQAAVDAAAVGGNAGGGTVHFPGGTYFLADGSSITLPGDVQLVGSEIRRASISSKNAYALQAPAIGSRDNVRIRHLSFTLRSGSTSGGAIKAVSNSFHSGWRIADCEATGVSTCTDPVYWVDGWIGSSIERCQGGSGGGHQYLLSNAFASNICHFVDCRAQSGVMTSTSAGFYIDGGGHVVLERCTVESNTGYGVYLNAVTGPTIRGCWFESNTNDNIRIVNTTGAQIVENRFSSQTGAIPAARHIIITETNPAQRSMHTIANNLFVAPSTSGVYLDMDDNVRQCLIAHNRGLTYETGTTMSITSKYNTLIANDIGATLGTGASVFPTLVQVGRDNTWNLRFKDGQLADQIGLYSNDSATVPRVKMGNVQVDGNGATMGVAGIRHGVATDPLTDGGSLYFSGSANRRVGFAVGNGTNQVSKVLVSEGAVQLLNGALNLQIENDAAKLWFGTALDASLARNAASIIAVGPNGGGFQFTENGTTDLAAGAANTARLYVKDNGAGKSQLCVRFNTGAVQVIATEP